MVRRARIIISTAGPFELYSDGVVEACVRLGSHYLDISGETLWTRSLIERFHDQANASGIRIIPSCGFDSVPSDLAAMWADREIGGADEIKAYYEVRSGQPNGGTVATGFHVASSPAKDQLKNPFLLVPKIHRLPRPVEVDPAEAHYETEIATWVAPFVMGPVNTRVVRRSCALLGLDFAYQEYAKCSGAFKAYAANAARSILTYLMESPRMRRGLQKMSPISGTGPSEKSMSEGWFRCDIWARKADGRTIRGFLSGQGDPANRITVTCLCESGLTLACEERLPNQAGVLTPSTGLGQALQGRLSAKGIMFSTEYVRAMGIVNFPAAASDAKSPSTLYGMAAISSMLMRTPNCFAATKSLMVITCLGSRDFDERRQGSADRPLGRR